MTILHYIYNNSSGRGRAGAHLLADEAGQDVHDEAAQPWVHAEALDDGAHQQHGQRALLHQLLHHHRQHLRRVHVLLPVAQVGGCGGKGGERSGVSITASPSWFNKRWGVKIASTSHREHTPSAFKVLERIMIRSYALKMIKD